LKPGCLGISLQGLSRSGHRVTTLSPTGTAPMTTGGLRLTSASATATSIGARSAWTAILLHSLTTYPTRQQATASPTQLGLRSRPRRAGCTRLRRPSTCMIAPTRSAVTCGFPHCGEPQYVGPSSGHTGIGPTPWSLTWQLAGGRGCVGVRLRRSREAASGPQAVRLAAAAPAAPCNRSLQAPPHSNATGW
jgi:hypothetical protein